MMNRALVVVCHNGPTVWRQTTQSLMELGWGDRVAAAKLHGFEAVDFCWIGHFPRVDAMRDWAAQTAVEDGFTHLLYLDADMVWPTNLLERILRHHDRGIVSGLYFLKTQPFAPVALRDGTRAAGSVVTQYRHDIEYLDDASGVLRPVEVVGMGCTLVPTAIFPAIGPRPWFLYADDDQGWPRISEDVSFCERARAAGWAVWVDPTIKCGHVTGQVIDERWCRRWRASAKETERHVSVQVVPTSAA